MPLRIPVGFDAEYRGQAPAGSFSRDGETIDYGPKLKFEYEAPDGDVVVVPIGANTLDNTTPAFDHSKLVKGDRVRIEGFAVLSDRGSGRDSYLRVESVQALDGKSLRAAS